jgi:uncharacterized membrane protein HdeD (DUF308 family)
MSVEPPVEQQILRDLWWLMLLRGLALVAVGLLFLFRPVVPLTVAILMMGVYWFVDGVLTVARALKGRPTGRPWVFTAGVGALSILAGVVVFSRPVASALLTTTFLVYFLALAALISGLVRLTNGIRLRGVIAHPEYAILGGTLSVLFGIMLFASPLYSTLILVKSLGVLALLIGVILLAMTVRMRNAAKREMG